MAPCAQQVLWQLRIERAIFLTEWKWLAAAVLVEYTHMVIGVLVYYIEVRPPPSVHAQPRHYLWTVSDTSSAAPAQ